MKLHAEHIIPVVDVESMGTAVADELARTKLAQQLAELLVKHFEFPVKKQVSETKDGQVNTYSADVFVLKDYQFDSILHTLKSYCVRFLSM